MDRRGPLCSLIARACQELGGARQVGPVNNLDSFVDLFPPGRDFVEFCEPRQYTSGHSSHRSEIPPMSCTHGVITSDSRLPISMVLCTPQITSARPICPPGTKAQIGACLAASSRSEPMRRFEHARVVRDER